MTIFRDQRWHHPDRKFVQHGWRGTCGSSLLHNTDFSTQRILSRQRTPSVASPDSGAPHGDHWFNGRLTFRSHFPILRWFFYLDIILQWNLRKTKEIIFLVSSLQDMHRYINCKLFWSYLSWNKRFPLIKLWIHLMNYTYIFFFKIKFITSMLNFLQF